MSWSFVTSGSGSDKSGNPNVATATMGAAHQVGDLIVVVGSVDSSAGGSLSGSASDDLGNSYTFITAASQETGNSGTTVDLCVAYSIATVAGTATVTFGTAGTYTSSAVAAVVYRSTQSIVLNTAVTAKTTGNGTAVAIAGAATPNASDLTVGCMSWEGPANDGPTGDSDTSGGNWGGMVSNATSGGSAVTNAGAAVQAKIMTSATAQTFNATLASSRDWNASIIAFSEQATSVSGSATAGETADTSTASGTVTNPVFIGRNAVVRGKRVRRVFRASTARPFGLVFHKGTAAASETNDTSTASGTFTPAPITGTATPTEGDDTSTASGTFQQNITGTAAPTETDDTSTATGAFASPFQMAFLLQARNRRVRRYKRGSTVRPVGQITFHRGTAAATETDDSSTASGTFTPAPITGSAAATEGDDTSTTSGLFTNDMVGTAAATEGNDTSTATGSFLMAMVVSPSPTTRRRIRRRYRRSTVRPIGLITFHRATAAATETADTSTATGTFVPPPITGTAAPTEGNDTSTGTGAFIGAITGSAAITEGNDTSTATGTTTTITVVFSFHHLRPRPVYKRPNRRSTTWRIVHPIVGTAAATEMADVPFANGHVPISQELVDRRKRRGGFEPPTRAPERRDFFETKRRVRNLEP